MMQPEDALLPQGTYPIWSPYDSHQAAAMLMEALAADQVSAPERGNQAMPTTFRQITDAELSALLALYAHLNPGDEPPPPPEAAHVWTSIQSNPALSCWGAYQDDVLAATCSLAVIPNLTRGGRPYGLIENVVTHPDYCRRGLGTAVLKRAQQEAWERGCYKVSLLTGSKNEVTLRFYERAGFERGVKTGFVARPDHS